MLTRLGPEPLVFLCVDCRASALDLGDGAAQRMDPRWQHQTARMEVAEKRDRALLRLRLAPPESAEQLRFRRKALGVDPLAHLRFERWPQIAQGRGKTGQLLVRRGQAWLPPDPAAHVMDLKR